MFSLFSLHIFTEIRRGSYSLLRYSRLVHSLLFRYYGTHSEHHSVCGFYSNTTWIHLEYGSSNGNVSSSNFCQIRHFVWHSVGRCNLVHGSDRIDGGIHWRCESFNALVLTALDDFRFVFLSNVLCHGYLASHLPKSYQGTRPTTGLCYPTAYACSLFDLDRNNDRHDIFRYPIGLCYNALYCILYHIGAAEYCHVLPQE